MFNIFHLDFSVTAAIPSRKNRCRHSVFFTTNTKAKEKLKCSN